MNWIQQFFLFILRIINCRLQYLGPPAVLVFFPFIVSRLTLILGGIILQYKSILRRLKKIFLTNGYILDFCGFKILKYFFVSYFDENNWLMYYNVYFEVHCMYCSTLYTFRYKLYIMQYTVYIVLHCIYGSTLYTLKYTIYIKVYYIHCSTLYSLQYIIFIAVHCIHYALQYVI